MYCKNCGKKLNPDDMFCSKCGTKVEKTEESIMEEEAFVGFKTDEVAETEDKVATNEKTEDNIGNGENKKVSKPEFKFESFNWDLEGFPEEENKPSNVQINWDPVMEESGYIEAEDYDAGNKGEDVGDADSQESQSNLEDIVKEMPAFDWGLGTTAAFDRSALNRDGEEVEVIEHEAVNGKETDEDFTIEDIESNETSNETEKKINRFYTFNQKNAEFQALLDKEYEKMRQRLKEEAEEEEELNRKYMDLEAARNQWSNDWNAEDFEDPEKQKEISEKAEDNLMSVLEELKKNLNEDSVEPTEEDEKAEENFETEEDIVIPDEEIIPENDDSEIETEDSDMESDEISEMEEDENCEESSLDHDSERAEVVGIELPENGETVEFPEDEDEEVCNDEELDEISETEEEEPVEDEYEEKIVDSEENQDLDEEEAEEDSDMEESQDVEDENVEEEEHEETPCDCSEEQCDQCEENVEYCGIFDETGEQETEEEVKEHKKKKQIVILDVLIVILLIIVVVGSILTFAGDSVVGLKIKNGIDKVTEQITGKKPAKDPKVVAEESKTPLGKLIERGSSKNKNVLVIGEDQSLKFEEGKDYEPKDVLNAPAFVDSVWYTNDKDKTVTYGDEVVGVVIKYYSDLVDKIRGGKNDILDDVLKDSKLYYALEELTEIDEKYEIQSISIGEIRGTGNRYYVLVNVSSNDDGTALGKSGSYVVSVVAEDKTAKIEGVSPYEK